MDQIALSYGISLTLLQVAARNELDVKVQVSPGLSIGPTELSKLLTEVKRILDESD
jgi:hypothetical protein